MRALAGSQQKEKKKKEWESWAGSSARWAA
jgi:hypothetical protein